MKLTKKIVNKIESVLYENEIDISKEASFFLSHVDDDLFCIFTRKNNNEKSEMPIFGIDDNLSLQEFKNKLIEYGTKSSFPALDN